jgi:hypothetical protein
MAEAVRISRLRQEEPIETGCWPAVREVEVGSQTRSPESRAFAARYSFIRPERPVLTEDAATTGTLSSQPLSNSVAGTNTFEKTQERELNIERLVNKVIVKVPHPVPPPSRFELLQQWEGEVRQVDPDEFTAVVRDITNPRSPEEEVTLSKDEVSGADLELVQPGAIFYWIIGYRVSRDGQKTRTSDLRFRRLPAWTSKEIKRARERAHEIERMLGIG